MGKPGRKPIDVARAQELRALGLNYHDVGIVLGDEARRRVPFTGGAVAGAVRIADKDRSVRA